jgi:GntR family transcriptional regulator/MocR family aminotransferase
MDYALLLDAFGRAHARHGWPRQRLLHECLRAAIRDGTLAAGTRLLATRALAQELGIARNTVLYAYEQLACEGFVVPDRRGTVVAGIAGAPRRRANDVAHAGLACRAQDLRTVNGAAGDGLPFTPGVPDLRAFPLAQWRRLLDRAWRGLSAAQLNYGDPAGEPALRTAIADYLRASRGVVCEPDQVFVTDGTQSSLDLCAHACADAGDTAWIENPGYGGALAAFRGAGLRVEGIAVDEEGMAPTARDWTTRRPRLIYTTPSHQYPIGAVMSPARRQALIAGARAASALIVEDDYDSEFRHEGPPLAAMQGLVEDAPVLYCGTFSKTMFPGLRIGFLVAPAGLAPHLAVMRAQSSAAGRAAEQLALAEFLRSGEFALHLRRMRRLYRQRRDALADALERHLGTRAIVEGASAGMHLALRLAADGAADVDIVRRARERGLFVNALSTHALPGGPSCNGLLLGYAQVPAERMDDLVRRLTDVILTPARPDRPANRFPSAGPSPSAHSRA